MGSEGVSVQGIRKRGQEETQLHQHQTLPLSQGYDVYELILYHKVILIYFYSFILFTIFYFKR